MPQLRARKVMSPSVRHHLETAPVLQSSSQGVLFSLILPVHLVRSGAGGPHLRNHGEFERGGVWVGGSIVCFSCGVAAAARVLPGGASHGITRTRPWARKISLQQNLPPTKVPR